MNVVYFRNSTISEKKNFNDNPFFIENRNLTHNIFLYHVTCQDAKKDSRL